VCVPTPALTESPTFRPFSGIANVLIGLPSSRSSPESAQPSAKRTVTSLSRRVCTWAVIVFGTPTERRSGLAFGSDPLATQSSGAISRALAESGSARAATSNASACLITPYRMFVAYDTPDPPKSRRPALASPATSAAAEVR
jgi:hypothetical protein